MEEKIAEKYRDFLLKYNPIVTNIAFCIILIIIDYISYNIFDSNKHDSFSNVFAIISFVCTIIYLGINIFEYVIDIIKFTGVNHIDSKYKIYGYYITDNEVIIYHRLLFHWHECKTIMYNYGNLDISQVMKAIDKEINNLDASYLSELENTKNQKKLKKQASLMQEELKTWKRKK